MSKVTSTDISGAISFAQGDPAISAELRRRDNDNRLDCVFIDCEIKSGIGNPVKRFKLVFNYAFISQTDARGEDIIVEIESIDGTMRIVRWNNA
jgi:hypothetical protein